jgi:hypothetical protein
MIKDLILIFYSEDIHAVTNISRANIKFIAIGNLILN